MRSPYERARGGTWPDDDKDRWLDRHDPTGKQAVAHVTRQKRKHRKRPQDDLGALTFRWEQK